MWAPPAEFGDPLYYHIRYGAAEMQVREQWSAQVRLGFKILLNTTDEIRESLVKSEWIDCDPKIVKRGDLVGSMIAE